MKKIIFLLFPIFTHAQYVVKMPATLDQVQQYMVSNGYFIERRDEITHSFYTVARKIDESPIRLFDGKGKKGLINVVYFVRMEGDTSVITGRWNMPDTIFSDYSPITPVKHGIGKYAYEALERLTSGLYVKIK